ncbi:MAG: DNA repair protein RadA [Ruminococcaceae bacterium]|nr:DNA repair protein RadA [Oscillospiraceae bacterium]
MAAMKSIYVCTNCGASFPRWFGRCSECGEWNTVVEDVVEKKSAGASRSSLSVKKKASELVSLSDVAYDSEIRYTTGIAELDRVLGGGVVKGSVTLIGGEPGAGKSTLLLQMCGKMAKDSKILYVSGEESVYQIKLRADRLGVDAKNIIIANETCVETVTGIVGEIKPDMFVIDSIQTMTSEEITSSAGSVTQVRECASLLMKCAKSLGIPLFIVGHVNKDGAIAGPKVMEHIVDTVLYFEGDKYLSYRILRAAKNRYGSTNEIGIFDMTSEGLCGIDNPSMLMLEGRDENASGSCVACVMEGSRPILAEIQSLAAKTGFGTPRRTSSGIDYNRTNLLLAVLEKRAGYFLSSLDVYINVVGGLSLDEPSCDLATVISLVSAVTDKPVPAGTVAFGEIGLGGEVRAVQSASLRIQEAQRLGFARCVLPSAVLSKLNAAEYTIKLIGLSNVREIKKIFCE